MRQEVEVLRPPQVSLSTFESMKSLMTPFVFSKPVKHYPVMPGLHTVPQGPRIRGRIAEHCEYAYMYNGTVIRCLPIVRNLHTDYIPSGYSPLALRTAPFAFHGSIISSVTEIPNHPFITSTYKLLIGLDSGTHGSLVIYDPVNAKPFQTIVLDRPVTSVAVLTQLRNVNQFPPSQFYNESMLAMVGIAAVGLLGGDIMLVDLGLDDLERRMNPRESYIIENDEAREFTVVKVDPHELNIAQFRHHSIANGQLICLPFNDPLNLPDEDKLPDYYYYESIDGIEEKLKIDVSISAMKYIPNCGYLIVGFNFGLIQIWDVSDMNIVYSSPIEPVGDLNVHSFEFQIPMDDPRNFAYLWVLLGSSTTTKSHGRVEFYTMEFHKKLDFDIDNNHPQQIFLDLKICAKRLSIILGDCYHLEETHERREYYKVRPLRIWTLPSKKESIVFISWEAVTYGTAYIGIFDLNQWYSAHTPEQVDIGGEQSKSFWTALCVTNPDPLSQMFDLRVQPKSIVRWNNPYKSNEIHLHPSSLTFQGIIFNSTETYMFEHYGIQEKLIRWIQKDGYALMSKPTIMHDLCHTFGIISYCTPLVEHGLSEKKVEQYYLLTVLLENVKTPIIVQMANRWLDGSYTNVGCGFTLLLDWLKWLTMYSRCCAEEHWVTMLLRGEKNLVPETNNFIQFSYFLWNLLSSLVNILLRPIEFDDEEIEDTESLRFAIAKLAKFSGALLYLRRAKLLPAVDNEDYNAIISTYCDKRRKDMKSRMDACPYFSPEDRGGHTLLIDYLFENLDEDCLKEDWETVDTLFYPPKHPRYILNFMLGSWIHVPQKHIARIIYYYVLDLVHFSNSSDTAYVEDVGSLLPLSEEDKRNISVIWKIDHERYSEAISSIQSCTLDDEREQFPWSAALVHLAVCGYEQQVINRIRSGAFSSKISRFMLNMACEIEPQNEDLVASILYSFSIAGHHPRCLESLFQIADAKGKLDTFIINQIYYFRPSLKDFVTCYMNSLPSCVENEIRLLRYYIILQDLKYAVHVYKKIIARYNRNRRLIEENIRTSLEEVEVELRKLHRLTRDPYGWKVETVDETESPVMYETPQPLEPERKDKTIKVIQLNSPEFKILPTCYKRLMKDGFEMKPGLTPMSPLRRYVGRTCRPLPVIHSPVTKPGEVTPNEKILKSIVTPGLNESLRTPLDQQPRQSIELNILEILKTPTLKNNFPTASIDVDMVNQTDEGTLLDSDTSKLIIKSSMKQISVLPDSDCGNKPISAEPRSRSKSNVSFAIALSESSAEIEEESIRELESSTRSESSKNITCLKHDTKFCSPDKPTNSRQLCSRSEPKQTEDQEESVEEQKRPKRKRSSSGPATSSSDASFVSISDEDDDAELKQASKLRRYSKPEHSVSEIRAQPTNRRTSRKSIVIGTPDKREDSIVEEEESIPESSTRSEKRDTKSCSPDKPTNSRQLLPRSEPKQTEDQDKSVEERKRPRRKRSSSGSAASSLDASIVSIPEEDHDYDPEFKQAPKLRRHSKPEDPVSEIRSQPTTRRTSRKSLVIVTPDKRKDSIVEEEESILESSTRSESTKKKTRSKRDTKSSSPDRPTSSRQLRSRSEPKQTEEQDKTVEERKRPRRKRFSSGPATSSLDASLVSIPEEDDDDAELKQAPKLRRHLKLEDSVSEIGSQPTTRRTSRKSLVIVTPDKREDSIVEEEESVLESSTRSESTKRRTRSKRDIKSSSPDRPTSSRQLRSRSEPKQTEEQDKTVEERKRPIRKRSSSGSAASSVDASIVSIPEDEDGAELKQAPKLRRHLKPEDSLSEIRSQPTTRRTSRKSLVIVTPDKREDSIVEEEESILESSTRSESTKKRTRSKRDTKSSSPDRPTSSRQLRSRSEPKQTEEQDKTVEERKRPRRRRSSSGPATSSLDASFVSIPEDDDDDDELKQPPKLRRHLKGFNYSPQLSTVQEITESSSMMENSNI